MFSSWFLEIAPKLQQTFCESSGRSADFQPNVWESHGFWIKQHWSQAGGLQLVKAKRCTKNLQKKLEYVFSPKLQDGTNHIFHNDISHRYSDPNQRESWSSSSTSKHQSSSYANSLATGLICAKIRIPPHTVAIVKVHNWTHRIPWSRHVGPNSTPRSENSFTAFAAWIVKTWLLSKTPNES